VASRDKTHAPVGAAATAGRPFVVALGVFVCWKLLLVVAGYFAPYKFHLGLNDPWSRVATSELLKHTYKFDAKWYGDIAAGGYAFDKSAPAFYPLFPLLVATFTRITHDAVMAAFVINGIAALAAFYLLYRLALDYLKQPDAAAYALLLFAFFPTAYFLHVMYSEAVFCALTLGAFVAASRRQWLLANVCVALTTATRLPGLVVGAGILVSYLQSIEYNPRKITRSACWFLLAPLGIVAYAIHLKMVTGDAFAMFNVYKFEEWAYERLNLNIPSAAIAEARLIAGQLVHRPAGWQVRFFDHVLPFACWLWLGLCTVWGLIKRMPHGYVVLMAGSFALFGAHTVFTATDRYLMAVFPAFLLGAAWLQSRSEWLRMLVLAGSAMAMTLLYALFVNGIWTA